MIYLITGRRELGKTTLAMYLAHAKRPRCYVDPRQQFDQLDLEPVDQLDAFPVLDDLDNGQDVWIVPDDMDRDVADLAGLVQPIIRNREQLTILFDEAGLYPDGLKAWDRHFRTCSRQDTTIILTAHRPQDVSTRIRAIVDTWCIFRTTQAHDLEAIRDRCGQRVRDLVEGLDPYQFVAWDDAKGEWRIHRDGRIWKTPKPDVLSGELDRVPSRIPLLDRKPE